MADAEPSNTDPPTGSGSASSSSSQTPTGPTYDLLVKNPTDRPGAESFSVQISSSQTVHSLKTLLTATYPGSPPVSAQRLIHAGKLLDDRHTLQSILGDAHRPVQHTIHLVVSHRFTSSPTSRSVPQPPSQTNPIPQNPFLTPGVFHPPQLPPIPPVNNIYQPTHPHLDPATYQLHYPYPIPPPPSDNPNIAPTATPFAPIDPTAYAAHLQSMERIIAETLTTNLRAAAAADAAAADAQLQGERAAHVAQAAAAQAAAAAVAMHAQAHVQAMANYDAGLRAQMPGNGQPFPQQTQPGATFVFALGRGNGAQGAAPNQQQAAQEGPLGQGAPRVRQFVFQFEINWALILKLLFLVYLLGQEGSPRRVYTLLFLAVGIYLWQTNRLGFLRRVVAIALPNPVQLFEMLFPRRDVPEDGNDEGADSQNEEAPPRPREVNRFGRVVVILSFIYSFFYGFVCSLLPAWRPEPLPRIEELLNPPENQNEEPQGAEGPAADAVGEGNGHEHAD